MCALRGFRDTHKRTDTQTHTNTQCLQSVSRFPGRREAYDRAFPQMNPAMLSEETSLRQQVERLQRSRGSFESEDDSSSTNLMTASPGGGSRRHGRMTDDDGSLELPSLPPVTR